MFGHPRLGVPAPESSIQLVKSTLSQVLHIALDQCRQRVLAADFVANPELVFGLGCFANSDQELPLLFAYLPLNTQQVAQINMVQSPLRRLLELPMLSQ